MGFGPSSVMNVGDNEEISVWHWIHVWVLLCLGCKSLWDLGVGEGVRHGVGMPTGVPACRAGILIAIIHVKL